MKCHIYFLIVLSLYQLCNANKSHNKYSKEANEVPDKMEHLKEMKTPLRMNKLNLVWQKAVKRLSPPKLKKLLGELRIQDKEELTLKKIKSEGGDKGGIKEAELRKKLLGIMKNYSLNDHFQGEEISSPPISSNSIEKAIFADKKLNKLWNKAVKAGFSDEELKALKEEFQHHQDKIDQYDSLVDMHHEKINRDMNSLDNDVLQYGLNELDSSDKHTAHHTNTIREKHRDIKKGYDKLHKITSTGPDSKEFIEPKVAGLWRLATNADFNQEELESLHIELKHYESRLLKVRHLTGELELKDQVSKLEEKLESNNSHGQNFLEERLEKQKRKIEKLHEDLELRILARHSEL